MEFQDLIYTEANGVATIAICSNDASQYPEDSFEKMAEFARASSFSFPYLHDADQNVARAYDAVCTPDFFGFNAKLELQYRGRLDASRKELVPDARRDLYEAMKRVAETGNTALIDGVRRFALDVRNIDIDLIDSITLVERMDEVTGLTSKVVVDYKQVGKSIDLRPRLQLKDDGRTDLDQGDGVSVPE